MQVMYIIKKQKSFRNWFHSKKVSYFKENTNKVMIYQFLTDNLFRLDVFDREFLKISNIKPQNLTSPKDIKGFNLKNHQ